MVRKLFSIVTGNGMTGNPAGREIILSSTASFVLLLTLPMRRYRLFRSTEVTMAPFLPLPIIVLLPNPQRVPVIQQS